MKWIGVVFIVVPFSTLGFIMAGNYYKRPRQLRQLQGAFQILETQICYGATPLPEALLYVARRCHDGIGLIFKITGELLLSGQGMTAYEAWKKGVEDMISETALNKEDEEILFQFGANLGNSDREEQLKHLRLLQTQLKEEEKKSNEARQNNERLWKYGGVLVGLLFALLLL